jgi:hypothetical protein
MSTAAKFTTTGRLIFELGELPERELGRLKMVPRFSGPRAISPGQAAETTSCMRANPIRKVATMLQSTREDFQDDGKQEQELYDTFK